MDPIIIAQGFSAARAAERERQARELEWLRVAHERASQSDRGEEHRVSRVPTRLRLRRA